MTVQIFQFNTAKDKQARWFQREGDVSRAYGTEAGRSQVWLWWLMEHMATWAGPLQSVKPWMATNFVGTADSDTTATASAVEMGFMARAAYAETGGVVDAGVPFPGVSFKYGDLYESAGDYIENGVGNGMYWDDFTEAGSYPGFYSVAPVTYRDFEASESPSDLFDYTPAFNSSFAPSVIYSLDPGKEFFLSIIPSTEGGPRRWAASVIGIARIQNMPAGADRDGSLNNGWFQVKSREESQMFFPLGNSDIKPEWFGWDSPEAGHSLRGLDPVSGTGDGYGNIDYYFQGYVSANLGRMVRWRNKMHFYSGLGVPLGSTGDFMLSGMNRLTSVDYGQPMLTQRKYNGKIYLCISDGLFWRIS